MEIPMCTFGKYNKHIIAVYQRHVVALPHLFPSCFSGHVIVLERWESSITKNKVIEIKWHGNICIYASL